MSLFKDEEIEQYVGDLLWEVKNKDKTVFNYITCDSQTEKPFAEACNADENVLFYFKMPKGFKIPTPLGFYIPDWAVIVKEEDKPKIYFVVETKSTLSKQGLRGTENLKIECAEKHFGLFQNEMIYKKVTKLKEVST
jgi:type III restriction enzyme